MKMSINALLLGTAAAFCVMVGCTQWAKLPDADRALVINLVVQSAAHAAAHAAGVETVPESEPEPEPKPDQSAGPGPIQLDLDQQQALQLVGLLAQYAQTPDEEAAVTAFARAVVEHPSLESESVSPNPSSAAGPAASTSAPAGGGALLSLWITPEVSPATPVPDGAWRDSWPVWGMASFDLSVAPTRPCQPDELEGSPKPGTVKVYVEAVGSMEYDPLEPNVALDGGDPQPVITPKPSPFRPSVMSTGRLGLSVVARKGGRSPCKVVER